MNSIKTYVVNVINTVTNTYAGTYCDAPKDAVLAAYAQNMFRDFSTRNLQQRYGHLLTFKHGNPVCGPFAISA